MKIKLSAFIIVFCLSATMNGQFPNPSDFNSATNSANNGTLAVGIDDLHWKASLNGISGPYIPAVSCGNQGWYNSPVMNAGWISYPHTCTPGDPAEHFCENADREIYYKLEISLPSVNCENEPVSTPGSYCLTLDMYADNSVYEVFVNGVSNYLNPTTNPYYDLGYSSGNNKTISLCNNWQPGNNSVIVHVRSGSGTPLTWEGLLVTATQTVSTQTTPLVINPVGSGGPKCLGASVTLTASGALTYTWQPGNISGAGASFNPTITTTYTVTGLDEKGCPRSANFTQIISICQGMEELNTSEISIYPNPTKGRFELENMPANSIVQVFNLLGERIYENKNVTGSLQVDLDNQGRGIYLVKIMHENRAVLKKIIKE